MLQNRCILHLTELFFNSHPPDCPTHGTDRRGVFLTLLVGLVRRLLYCGVVSATETFQSDLWEDSWVL